MAPDPTRPPSPPSRKAPVLSSFSISPWILAARPRTLTAAAAPVIVAVALAWEDGSRHWAAAFACLAVSVLLQIGANYANDLFDYERGSDTADRLGPVRVTAAGWIDPRTMRKGTAVVFFLAALPGVYLFWLRGWPVLVLGAALILLALAYTGGPFPYGYHALGDLFVFLCFGPAALGGTYYVLTGTLTAPALGLSLALGALIVNILVVNNTRDRFTDAAAGKRTLAVVWGRKAMNREYVLAQGMAYLIPLGFWLFHRLPGSVLLPWLSLPRAVTVTRRFFRTEGRPLNAVLSDTALLVLVYSFLLALGLFLGG